MKMVAEYRARQPFYEKGNNICCPITNKMFPYEQGSLQGRRDALAAQQDWTYQQRAELNKVYGREVTIREWAKIARGESILPQKPVPVAVSNQQPETNPYTAVLRNTSIRDPRHLEKIRQQEAEWTERKISADKIAAVKESDDFRRAQTHATASLNLANIAAAAGELPIEYVEARRRLAAEVEKGNIQNYWIDQEPLDQQYREAARNKAAVTMAVADDAKMKLAEAEANVAVSTGGVVDFTIPPIDLNVTE